MTAQFVTSTGVIGTFAASQVASGRKNRLSLEVSGLDESYAFDQEQPERLWVGERRGARVEIRDGAHHSRDAERLSFLPPGHAQGYQDAFNAFVADTYASIRGIEVDGVPTFEDGVRASELIDAAIRSARDGGAWVSVPLSQQTIAPIDEGALP